MFSTINTCITQNLLNLGLGKYYLKFYWYNRSSIFDHSALKIETFFNSKSLGILTANKPTMHENIY